MCRSANLRNSTGSSAKSQQKSVFLESKLHFLVRLHWSLNFDKKICETKFSDLTLKLVLSETCELDAAWCSWTFESWFLINLLGSTAIQKKKTLSVYNFGYNRSMLKIIFFCMEITCFVSLFFSTQENSICWTKFYFWNMYFDWW